MKPHHFDFQSPTVDYIKKMKSLLNSPSTCVDDLVDSLLLTNQNLVRVKGFNAVVLENITGLKEEQVTLLSGRLSLF